jgi:hypothetical protein
MSEGNMSEELFTEDYDFTPTPLGENTTLDFEEEDIDFEDSQNFGEQETEMFGTIQKKEKKFECLETSFLIKEKKKKIQELSETLDIPFSVCGALIRAYQWKTEK